MKIVKRLSFSLLSALLAVLMSFLTPVQCIGAENKIVYISDIEFAYGDNGISELESAGYTVWKDLNANEGGNGDSVWVGYKTTSDINDAITDVAMMNMKGGYSFTEWENEFKQLNKNVNALQNDFIAGVNEFRQNYKNGSEYAKVAYRLLNLYVEEDSEIALGDLLLDDNLSTSDVHKILLEGNTESLDIIEKSIAIGLVDCNGENIITRLATSEYSNELDVRYNHQRTLLLNAIVSFRQALVEAERVVKTAEEYNGGTEAYINSLEDNDAASAVYQIELVKIAKQVRFGNLVTEDSDGEKKRLSLYDVAMLNTEESEEEENPGLVLDAGMADMLRLALTDGQASIIGYVGIGTVLLNAYAAAGKNGYATVGITYDDDGKASFTFEEATSERTVLDSLKEVLAELEKLDKVSVYYGVDREVFSNTSEVAMTSNAIRERALSGDTSFGRGKQEIKNDADYTRMRAFAIVSGASAAVGIGCFIGSYALYQKKIAMNPINMFTYDLQISQISSGNIVMHIDITGDFRNSYQMSMELSKYKLHFPKSNGYSVDYVRTPKNSNVNMATYSDKAQQVISDKLGTASKGLLIAGVIAVIIMVLSIVATLIDMYRKPKIKDYVYTEIPKILVDVSGDSSGRKNYTYYRAVKLVKPLKDGSKTIYRYGDVNALNNTDEWYVMYYAKDLRLGAPLTPEILIKHSGESLSMTEQAEYRAAHDFGSTAAADLNYHNSKNTAGIIYLYFKTASFDTSNPDSGSFFNLENGIICLSSVIFGGLVAFGITYLAMRKKKTTSDIV